MDIFALAKKLTDPHFESKLSGSIQIHRGKKPGEHRIELTLVGQAEAMKSVEVFLDSERR